MVRLDNIKLVLFDFDDTLCLHDYMPNTKQTLEEFYTKILTKGSSYYDKGERSEHMQKFIDICKLRKIPMGLLSAASSYLGSEAKVQWVKDNYGITLTNYSVGKAENKVAMLTAIALVNNYQHDEILLVDDYYINLEAATEAGFLACTPMKVANYVQHS